MIIFKYIVFEDNVYSEIEEEPVNNYFNEEYLESEELERFLDTRERVNDLNSEYSNVYK